MLNKRSLNTITRGLLSTLLAVCLFVPASAQTKPQLPPDFDAFMHDVLKTFQVPGMAVGVVQDGKVILNAGYGVRELGKETPVDAHTLFPIASNSKAFTATALALLVEDGKLEWDAPVIQYLPDFRLSNSYVTEQLSVRDLLVHRSGIAPYAGDLMQFPPTDFTRKELVYRLRYLPLSTSFRSTYAYDNVLYLVAAEVIQAVSGKNWEEFIQDRIFQKLGMQESHAYLSKFHDAENKASSHAPVDGQVRVLHHFKEQGLGDISNPAGGINSNVHDMSKWLLTQLDSGRVGNGQTLFKPSTARELWTGVTPIPVPKVPEWMAPAQTDMNSYALGFRVYTYRGEKMVTHGGKLDGFVSFVNMVPAHNLGIVVLTNQESTNAYNTVINHLLDYYMGKPSFDWLSAYKRQEDLKFERIARIENQAQAEHNENSKPALPLSAYAGTYEDAWYGKVKITQEGDKLMMDFTHSPELKGDMEFWQYNTFVVRWRNRDLRADAYVTYDLDELGKIKRISMKAISPITDVSYDFHDLDLVRVDQ